MVDRRPTVAHVITTLNDGGAEAVLYRLCLHSRSVRHVVVSMMGPGKYGPLLEAAGVVVHCLNMPPGKATWGGVVGLWRVLRRERPFAVQTWMYHADLFGGVLARLSGVRRVFWGIHNSNLSPDVVSRSTILVARLCALLSRAVPTRVVSCSQQASRVHVALGYGARGLVNIPNGYDLARYARDEAGRVRLRGEWGVAPHEFLAGMVARFDPQKDHANLLGALGQLKRRGLSFKCVLVGTGMDEGNAALMALVARDHLGSDVLLMGRRDDVPAVMSALDVHVLSSLGEAFPNVLAEAMACGTPCVTTDVGDAALIVGDTGWVVPPQNAAALAEGLDVAHSDWARGAESWGGRQAAARERITGNFDLDRMTSAYEGTWLSTPDRTS